MSENDIINGKNSRMTNVYRLADKEVVYSFYGNDASSLTWTPGQDKLSFLLKE